MFFDTRNNYVSPDKIRQRYKQIFSSYRAHINHGWRKEKVLQEKEGGKI